MRYGASGNIDPNQDNRIDPVLNLETPPGLRMVGPIRSITAFSTAPVFGSVSVGADTGCATAVLKVQGGTHLNGPVGVGICPPATPNQFLLAGSYVMVLGTDPGGTQALRIGGSMHMSANGAIAIFDGGASPDANSGLRIVAPINTTHYNWMIGAQQNVSAAVEITPSTVVGGTSFTTPVFSVLQSGQATHTAITGVVPLFMSAGGAANFQIGPNVGSSGTNTTFGIYSGTIGGGTPMLHFSATGAATFIAQATATFLDLSAIGAQYALRLSSAGSTSNIWQRISNLVGVTDIATERSIGAGQFTGSSAYASVFGSQSATACEFASNGVVRYSINSAGNHDFKSGSITTTGNVGIGGGALSEAALVLLGFGVTGTADQFGVYSNVGFGSAATNSGRCFYAQLQTTAAAFTMTSGYGLHVDDAIKGAGSTITTQYGIKVENQTKGATNYAINTGTGLVTFGDLVTINGQANKDALDIAGGALTGSATNSVISITQLWNTGVGAPTLFKANVNNAASAATSLFFDWQTSGVSLFRFNPTVGMTLGDSFTAWTGGPAFNIVAKVNGSVGSATGLYVASSLVAQANGDNLFGSVLGSAYNANGKTGTTAYGAYITDVSGAATNYALMVAGGGNVALFSGGAGLGGGDKVISIHNATTDPTSNPTAGGILYCSGGALKYRGSSGTVTTIAVA